MRDIFVEKILGFKPLNSNCICLRLDWFVHENSINFPKEYLEEAFGNKYACEETWISPQRFGKPMNRCEVVISMVFVIAIDECCLHRLRSYKVYYLKSKYQWRGPPLRQLLKALLPLQPLQMDADALFFMTKSELEAWLSFIIGNIFFGFLEISIELFCRFHLLCHLGECSWTF